MKKFIIVEHRAKEFANRLWSDMSVYSYSLEAGAKFINRSAFEHTLYPFFVDRKTRRGGAIWALGSPKYLPPTAPLPEKFDRYDRLYFFGWLFRNPAGFVKYRAELLAKFGSTEALVKKIDILLSPVKSKTLIGVDIKQIPFRGFEDGEFLVSPKRVRQIVDEYVKFKQLSPQQVALVVVSDREVDRSVFEGYEIYVSAEDVKTNLFLLSKCSAIIGINSTFSNLAAWFGDVPHIVTKEEPLDWEYYRGKDKYFENKYATFSYGKTT